MDTSRLPITIYLYLAIIICVTLYAYKNCYLNTSKYGEILEGFAVTGISILLVVAYYYPKVGDFFGDYIFILVVIGSAYHIKYRHSYIYEPEENVEEPQEQKFYKYFNMVLIAVNLMLILPAYILGVLSGVRYV